MSKPTYQELEDALRNLVNEDIEGDYALGQLEAEPESALGKAQELLGMNIESEEPEDF